MGLNTLKNKLTAAILCLMVAFPAPLFAQDEPVEEDLSLDLRVTPLLANHRAPYSGILLTSDAMQKIKFDHRLELDLMQNDLEYMNKAFQLQVALTTAVWDVEKNMYSDRIAAKDEYIKKLEGVALEKNDWTLVYIAGAFALGALATVGVAYAIEGAR